MAKRQPEAPATKFEMVALYIASDNSNVPVLGNSHYIVLDKSTLRIALFHPFTFSKFTLPEPDFRMALLPFCDWNDRAKIADWLEKQAVRQVALKRQAPYKLVREIIAHYRECDVKDIADFHGEEV